MTMIVDCLFGSNFPRNAIIFGVNDSDLLHKVKQKR